MKTYVIAITMLASALLLPLTACSQSGQDTNQSDAASDARQATKEIQPSTIAAEVHKGVDKAKQELLTQDINVDDVHVGDDSHQHDDSLPKAVITPQGELVIAGKPVEATPEQHTMLLDYRQQIIDIADAGMDIGASGADLGTTAAKQAILGAFSGKSDQEIEASLKPQTDQIKAAALRLCGRLPGLMASQQKLAAAMPAFKPYATMTQKDIDDCGKDITDQNGKKGIVVLSN
jgi:hypothetical protein